MTDTTAPDADRTACVLPADDGIDIDDVKMQEIREHVTEPVRDLHDDLDRVRMWLVLACGFGMGVTVMSILVDLGLIR